MRQGLPDGVVDALHRATCSNRWSVNASFRLAARLKVLRQGRGFTQKILAAKAGLSREYVVRLEAGRYSPTLHVLERIAAALEVPVTELLR